MSSDDQDNDELNYEVEGIDDARYDGNEWSFLVKWKNYPSLFNTWESESNFNQHEVIDSFFKAHKTEELLAPSRNELVPKESLELTDERCATISRIYPKITEKQIENILGVKKVNGTIICLVKVQGYPKPLRIPSKKLRQISKTKLIQFYEKKIVLGNK